MLTLYESPRRYLFLRLRGTGPAAYAEWAELDTSKIRRQEGFIARLLVRIIPCFAPAEGEAAVFAPDPSRKARTVELVADNHTAVLADGTLCYQLVADANSVLHVYDLRNGTNEVLPAGSTWQKYLADLPGEQLMLQGQQFNKKADTEPFTFSEFCEQHILAALAMGRFD